LARHWKEHLNGGQNEKEEQTIIVQMVLWPEWQAKVADSQ